MLKAVGAIFAAVAALLLIVAPASQAATPSPTPPPSSTSFQNSISGFLRGDDRAPIANVTITAKSGDFTGTTKSGPNGSWNIGVPTQGTYEVELDVKTLPQGIKLAETKLQQIQFVEEGETVEQAGKHPVTRHLEL